MSNIQNVAILFQVNPRILISKYNKKLSYGLYNEFPN